MPCLLRISKGSHKTPHTCSHTWPLASLAWPYHCCIHQGKWLGYPPVIASGYSKDVHRVASARQSRQIPASASAASASNQQHNGVSCDYVSCESSAFSEPLV
ncbi:hypothetical protein BC834DRAFT_605041 [Gloeopeniophorella convolvens]|nr:hypothetical protein BC834DRAFT_605041 [Gloeopeniophorella convolvens]